MATFTVTCPHCRACLEIDGEAQVVVGHKPPEEKKEATSLEERLRQLEEEKKRAADRLAEAMRAEQVGSRVREEKFKKLLAEVGPEEVQKPVRDVDLD